MTAASTKPGAVLAFWREAGPSRWFRKDASFDREFHDRFLAAHEAAARGEFDAWAAMPDGALALCILLDQFPRNAFRGTPRMFATDAKARAVARGAIDSGFGDAVDEPLRQFFVLPLMHSEELEDQEQCVELARGLESDTHRYAVMHRDIIHRFGRFPHRNAVLGRESTPEEVKFLAEGGFAG
ncbi:DUF924 family protein [Ramlibacter sp. PS4R-6]|uniref:DUF924 family protein n=1 Tax=Ramlibacter sp. PS4R-6 TaxID=3133438 RepID=UPI00309A0EC9